MYECKYETPLPVHRLWLGITDSAQNSKNYLFNPKITESAQNMNKIIIMFKLGFGTHLLRQKEKLLAQIPIQWYCSELQAISGNYQRELRAAPLVMGPHVEYWIQKKFQTSAYMFQLPRLNVWDTVILQNKKRAAIMMQEVYLRQ